MIVLGHQGENELIIRIMEQAPEKKFPLNAKDYKLYEEVGEGVSATVYRAICLPLNERVAIKVLDLEKCNNDLVCPILLNVLDC